MTNPENLEEFQRAKISLMLKSCDELEKYVKNLKLIANNLQKSSVEIVGHILSGNLDDHEQNRKLWHGLNNVEHQLKQFTSYAEASTNNFAAEAAILLEKLRALRPPKAD